MTGIHRLIKSAVVTGPTGNIGSALVSLLESNNIKVYAVVRPESKRTSAIRPSALVHIVKKDASSMNTLHEDIIHADAFFNLAWAFTDGEKRYDTLSQTRNIEWSVEAVRAASELGCKVFVGAGSQAEYGCVEGLLSANTPCAPTSAYGIAKLQAGQMTGAECRRLNIAHIWPRILSVYGPNNTSSIIGNTILKLLRGETMQFTAGEQKWDFLYSADAARALYLMALQGIDNTIYPLGSGSTITIRECVEKIRDIVAPEAHLSFGSIPYAPDQVMWLQADISELTEDTGFIPHVPFHEGVRYTYEWIKNTIVL